MAGGDGGQQLTVGWLASNQCAAASMLCAALLCMRRCTCRLPFLLMHTCITAEQCALLHANRPPPLSCSLSAKVAESLHTLACFACVRCCSSAAARWARCSALPSLRTCMCPNSQPPFSLSCSYSLGAVLGAGSFGVVRECTERRTGRRFAVKSINKVGGC